MTFVTCKLNKVLSSYHFKYFQNNPILTSGDYTNPPDLPTLKVTLPPGEVVVSIFFTKMREKDELKGTRSRF